jgi:2-methylcitrate dehydratase PrpD
MSGQSPPPSSASALFAAHTAAIRAADLPGDAISAVCAFVLDTVGVGLAGARQPAAQSFARVFGRTTGMADQWAGEGRFGPAEAAAINAFQAHCQEFDCVHEAAVLHPFTVVTPVLIAEAQEAGMDGQTFAAAAVAGVEVAAGLGVAARSQIKFFRPATCGLFGATAALSRARGLNENKTVAAFGYALSFAAGTMQAHVEGTPALAASVGHAARAAFDAVALAQAGLPGPKGALDGPFGYLSLFETAFDLEPVLKALGAPWRVTQVSWKPFPTGRAAHGGIDMAVQLRAKGVNADNLDSLTIEAPPLIHHLVGRPIVSPLEVNYARLCLPYCAAYALRHGGVGLEAFAPEALADEGAQALAAKITVVKTDNPDPAAFTPQRALARLSDGRTLETSVETLLGSPARPLSSAQAMGKFLACAQFAGLPAPNAAALYDAVERLPALEDVGILGRLAAGSVR